MSAAAESELEFRSASDDAWYSVLVVGRGERLTVKYVGFTDAQVEVFEAREFESLEELKEFEERFRPVSVQLQDKECSKAIEGLKVCASHSFNGFDLRFYDAVIEHVINERHSKAKGEEECLCSFILTWQHGPNASIMMEKKIESICLVQSNEKPDRNMALFLEIAKEKIGKKCAKRSVSQIRPSEGWVEDINETDKQDADFGGADNYLILIENLEKDLSPTTITEFIHQQTSIVAQSFVFPSSSKESYARGAIVLNTHKDFRVLCEFFNNPGHFIISSRGRPWVVARNVLRHDISTPTGSCMIKSQKKLQNGSAGISRELKLAYSGTEEFKKAKLLRDLHVEFTFHLERLHKRLATEEKKILQPSPAAV